MTRRFCDKCEKEIREASTFIKLDMVFFNSNHKDCTADLCYECAKELDAWLYNPQMKVKRGFLE